MLSIPSTSQFVEFDIATECSYEKGLTCIRQTSNAVSVDAAAAECLVYFDWCPEISVLVARTRFDRP
ncbi:MAG: hypothetical protein ACI9DC_002550 [Gammaproteobacteria bacterium]|jgi:hypothetical protein